MGLMTAEEAQDSYVPYEEVKPQPVSSVPTDEIGRPSLTELAARTAQQQTGEAQVGAEGNEQNPWGEAEETDVEDVKSEGNV